jgi:hypothetical protein
METDQSAQVRLDGEQRAQVLDCLAKESITLSRERFDRLIREIKTLMKAHLDAEPKGTEREADDALAELWQLSHDDDPSPVLLRMRIQALPRAAADYIDRRFPIVFERLFSAEAPVREFQKWAPTADRESLFVMTQLLSAQGARWVEGRSRGGGKRSIARLEPLRRRAGAERKGGRPDKGDLQDLIMQLRGDWLYATEAPPKSGGRGDQTGFGDLVHRVFQWLGIPDGSATNALRQYWAARRPQP